MAEHRRRGHNRRLTDLMKMHAFYTLWSHLAASNPPFPFLVPEILSIESSPLSLSPRTTPYLPAPTVASRTLKRRYIFRDPPATFPRCPVANLDGAFPSFSRVTLYTFISGLTSTPPSWPRSIILLLGLSTSSIIPSQEATSLPPTDRSLLIFLFSLPGYFSPFFHHQVSWKCASDSSLLSLPKPLHYPSTATISLKGLSKLPSSNFSQSWFSLILP